MTDNTSPAGPLVIGLAGFGTVGSGLCELLRLNADLIPRRCGREVRIKTILVRDAGKARSVAVPAGARITQNPADLWGDPEIDVVCELMGGLDAARGLILKAFENGKDVVCANKALLAEHGLELFSRAADAGRNLRYEASVAGALPVIEILKESLAGNRVSAMMGILNGTSNYVLWEMTTRHIDFDAALARAREFGYAEADPSLDIDGTDCAHKLTVLIRLAFGLDYPFSALSVTGIRKISALDIRFADEFGYNIKLIGQVRDLGCPGAPRLWANVAPALVGKPFLMANVSGAMNALRVDANASGPLFFHGAGAGSLPTAGSVLADILAVARGEKPNNTGFDASLPPRADIAPEDEWPSPFYVRAMVADTPGVLRDLSGCMAAYDVSVAQMIQKAQEGESSVPLVFMTHETTASAIRKAIARAEAQGLLRQEAVCIRII